MRLSVCAPTRVRAPHVLSRPLRDAWRNDLERAETDDRPAWERLRPDFWPAPDPIPAPEDDDRTDEETD